MGKAGSWAVLLARCPPARRVSLRNSSACSSRASKGLTVEALALAQHIRDVARHDGVHLADVLAQLGHVALRPGVQVQLLRL